MSLLLLGIAWILLVIFCLTSMIPVNRSARSTPAFKSPVQPQGGQDEPS